MSAKQPLRPSGRPVPVVLVWVLVVLGVAIVGLGLWQLFGPVALRNVLQGWISVFLGIVVVSGGVNELVQRRGDRRG